MQRTTWMARHEIGHEILFLSQFMISFIKPFLKHQEIFYSRLSHEVCHMLDHMFRCDFQLAADMILAQFFDKFLL